jgi:pectate lyase
VHTRSPSPRRAALLAAGTALVAGLGAVAGSGLTAHAAAAGCDVTYRVTNQWPGGFGADVTVRNLGDPLTGWTVRWSYAAGQTVTQAWNATVTQSGSQVSAANAGYNGTLGTGAATSFGFNGSWTGTNPAPTGFTLNGVACTGGTTPTTPPTTAPPTTAPPTTRPPTTTPPTTPPATTPPGSVPTFPTPSGSAPVNNGTIQVSGTFDGGMKRYCCIGDGGQGESQDPVFELADGATIQNVILGAPAGDGIHCEGDCTIRNVWWEDVGEDAATFRGGDNYYVIGGGARSASDKVFQHNGPGTVHISGFFADGVGKLYRACGNCSSSYQRNVVLDNVTVRSTGALAGINTNWGDTARFTRITVYGRATICEKYRGVPSGQEPTKIGEGADGVNCLYRESDITYR